jgi:hypothetical protein
VGVRGERGVVERGRRRRLRDLEMGEREVRNGRAECPKLEGGFVIWILSVDKAVKTCQRGLILKMGVKKLRKCVFQLICS